MLVFLTANVNAYYQNIKLFTNTGLNNIEHHRGYKLYLTEFYLKRFIFSHHFYLYPYNTPGSVTKHFCGSFCKINNASHFRMEAVIYFYYNHFSIADIGYFYPGTKWQKIAGAGKFILTEYFSACCLPAIKFISIKACFTI